RLGIEAERLVGVADRLPDRRFDERLAGELAADARGGAVERGAHLEIGIGLRVGTRLVADGGLREQIALQELVDRFGRCGLGVGAAALRDGALLLRDGAVALGGRGLFRGERAVAFGRGRTLRRRRTVALLTRLLFRLHGAIALDDGLALGAHGAARLHRARDDPGDEDDEHRGDAGDERLVPPRELLQLIRRAGRPRDDRLVIEV